VGTPPNKDRAIIHNCPPPLEEAEHDKGSLVTSRLSLCAEFFIASSFLFIFTFCLCLCSQAKSTTGIGSPEPCTEKFYGWKSMLSPLSRQISYIQLGTIC